MSSLTPEQLAKLQGLPPRVRELRRAAYEKLNRGVRVQGALGAAQRLMNKAEAKARKVAAKLHPCMCGCGDLTKFTFVRGHAARFYQLIRRYALGELAYEDLPKAVRKVCHTQAEAKKALGNRYGGVE